MLNSFLKSFERKNVDRDLWKLTFTYALTFRNADYRLYHDSANGYVRDRVTDWPGSIMIGRWSDCNGTRDRWMLVKSSYYYREHDCRRNGVLKIRSSEYDWAGEEIRDSQEIFPRVINMSGLLVRDTQFTKQSAKNARIDETYSLSSARSNNLRNSVQSHLV